MPQHNLYTDPDRVIPRKCPTCGGYEFRFFTHQNRAYTACAGCWSNGREGALFPSGQRARLDNGRPLFAPAKARFLRLLEALTRQWS